MTQSIEARARFDIVRYANCWEDADLLCRALRPADGRRMLSIASAGDNAFALLADGAEVVAADLSPAQIALVELKRAAIRRLERDEVLAFLGVRAADNRLATFEALAPALPAPARTFWEERAPELAAGVVHQGKFENYFRLFRTRILPLIHRRRTILALLEERDEAGRRAFYQSTWNNRRWRLLFKVFFSRFVMGRMGRDPEFFRYAEGSVADRILERTRYALTVLPTHANPYMEYILTGGFAHNVPRYLRAQPFSALKERLDRLTVVQGGIDEAAAAHAGPGFDGFNLSDVFEYLAPDTCASIYDAMLRTARPGARLAYWNMVVPRSCPPEHLARVRSLTEEAERLFADDLAFFYGAFHLDEVI